MSAFSGLTDGELDALEYALHFASAYGKHPPSLDHARVVDELLEETRSELDDRRKMEDEQ